MQDHKYIFVLSPPFSGSTLITTIIEGSDEVSVNNMEGNKEGQFLPEVKDHMRKNAWDEYKELKWDWIHEVWHNHWDLSKPFLLEKSPPNICRAEKIQNIFKPSSFLVTIRNPYAFVEGKVRRDMRARGKASTEDSIIFWLKCAKWQQKNRNSLDNVFFYRYEDLCHDPRKLLGEMADFIFQDNRPVNRFKLGAKNPFKVKTRKIVNSNREKIKKLSKKQVEIISDHLSSQKELLQKFDYEII